MSWDLKSSYFRPIQCSATEWGKVYFLHYGFAIITLLPTLAKIEMVCCCNGVPPAKQAC